MRLMWFTSVFLYHIPCIHSWAVTPWIERYHYPGYWTTAMTIYVNGTDTEIQSTRYTPDYRVEEKKYTVHNEFFKERERPYRLSPSYKQTYRHPKIEDPRNLACYCCTTYRRHVLLSACAVLTTRHILTTANPTVLILRAYGERKTLEGILGGWYDYDGNTFNSSLYYTPSRIHIHPMYKYDYEVNVSHPIPCLYDLSVWAATYRFYGTAWSWSGAVLCYRAASGWFEYSSTIPRPDRDLLMVIGYQFMKAFARRPLPWFKYGVKTKKAVVPCPKTDWHWFHCIGGEYWGRFGFDSGGSLHMLMEGKSYRVDGLSGMCSFSLKLRAFQLCHYFTVLDTYPVLNFMYDAYMGLYDYAYLDGRFQNTKWAAPIAWWGEWVPHNYHFGWEYYYWKPMPYYRR